MQRGLRIKAPNSALMYICWPFPAGGLLDILTCSVILSGPFRRAQTVPPMTGEEQHAAPNPDNFSSKTFTNPRGVAIPGGSVAENENKAAAI